MSEAQPSILVKAKLIGSGKEGDPWRVNLPHYQMVDGTIDYQGKTCEVLVPRRICENGQLSKTKVRKLYQGQAAWDHDTVLDDV